HTPVPARVSITEIMLALEAAVGNIHQAVRHSDGNLHALLRLIAPLVLVWPPDTRSFFFACGRDPRFAGCIFVERKAAEASLLNRFAGVSKHHLIHAALA